MQARRRCGSAGWCCRGCLACPTARRRGSAPRRPPVTAPGRSAWCQEAFGGRVEVPLGPAGDLDHVTDADARSPGGLTDHHFIGCVDRGQAAGRYNGSPANRRRSGCVRRLHQHQAAPTVPRRRIEHADHQRRAGGGGFDLGQRREQGAQTLGRGVGRAQLCELPRVEGHGVHPRRAAEDDRVVEAVAFEVAIDRSVSAPGCIRRHGHRRRRQTRDKREEDRGQPVLSPRRPNP